MNNIKLSILIPTYNYQQGIKELIKCLKGIDTKSRDHIEIIISDDSKIKIISRKNIDLLKLKFKNFKYIHNKNKLGGGGNWNKLISMASGEYYWLIHHDESWINNNSFLKNILKIINFKKPNIIILPLVKKKIIKLSKYKFMFTQRHSILKKQKLDFIKNPKFLLEINMIGPPSNLIIKKCKIYFNSNLKFLIDIDFYNRIFKKYKYQKILIINDRNLSIYSSQDNEQSITRLLDKKIIKKQEKKLLITKNKFNLNFKEKLYLIYSFIVFKFLSLISIRLYLISK